MAAGFSKLKSCYENRKWESASSAWLKTHKKTERLCEKKYQSKEMHYSYHNGTSLKQMATKFLIWAKMNL